MNVKARQQRAHHESGVNAKSNYLQMWNFNFNCGTTSEKMMGNDYNFKESEIACIIHKRERAKARFRLVKLERAQGECLGTESR